MSRIMFDFGSELYRRTGRDKVLCTSGMASYTGGDAHQGGHEGA
jgi:hypothetical protein